MRVYTIDPDDNITVFASPEQIGELQEGAGSFATEEELARLAGGWSGSRLVEVWNSLPGFPPVKKFADRKRGVRRIWKAIQGLGPGGMTTSATGRSERSTKKASVNRSRNGARKTKTEQIIALLKRHSGASLKAIVRATGWQAHSVRGFLSGKLGKQMGLRVKSIERNGERVYSLRS